MTTGLVPTPQSFQFHTVAMAAAYCVITVVAFFGNVLVIHLVVTRAYMKTTFNFLIVNMAIADLLVSVFIMPVQVTFLFTGQQWFQGGFGTVSCKWVYFSGNLSIVASIIALVAISLDRYFAIVYPFKHLPIVRNTKLITSLIWVVSALYMSPYLVIFDVDKSGCRMIWSAVSSNVETQLEFVRTYIMIQVITLYVIPLVIIAVLYIGIGLKLSSRKIPGNRTANVIRKAQRSKRKVLRMLIIVVVLFALCWMPAHIIHVAKFFHTMWFIGLVKKAPLLESIAFFLCHANSAINPILYVTLNEKFKREFFRLLTNCFPCIKPRTEHFLLTTVASVA